MRGILKSALERHRESLGPPVIDGERYTRREQASWDGGNKMFPSWKPGYLYLCPTRLLFYQGANKLWEVPIAVIRGAGIVERRWISKKTCPQLAVQRATAGGERAFHLRIEDIEIWQDRLQALIRTADGAEAEPGGGELQPKPGSGRARTPPRKRVTT